MIVKKLQKDYPAVLTIPNLPLNKQDFTNPCENTTSEIQINTTIHQLDQGKELDASIRRSLALVNIAENTSIQMVQQPRLAIIIQYPSGATQTASSATGKHCTNYRTETEALKQAATLVKDSLAPCSQTVFLTDVLSVLEALQTNKSPPPSNTNARTRQHMQSSSPIDPSTLRNPWQRANRSASQMRSTRRATINHHPLPGKDKHR